MPWVVGLGPVSVDATAETEGMSGWRSMMIQGVSTTTAASTAGKKGRKKERGRQKKKKKTSHSSSFPIIGPVAPASSSPTSQPGMASLSLAGWRWKMDGGLCINDGGTTMPASTGLCATVTLTSMCQVERARAWAGPRHRPRSALSTLWSPVQAVRGRLIIHRRWTLSWLT